MNKTASTKMKVEKKGFHQQIKVGFIGSAATQSQRPVAIKCSLQ